MNGSRWMLRIALATGSLALAVPVLAQAPVPRAGAGPDPEMSQRYQIAVMEGALEQAVQLGARVVSRQWRAVSPEMLFISGSARARGFRLEGYGVFFDVEVPSMRQSVAWSWRMIDRDAAGAATALQALRNHLKTVADSAQRKELELAIRRIELQVAPFTRPGDDTLTPKVTAARDATVVSQPDAPGAATSVAQRDVRPDPAPMADPMAIDPGVTYTAEVKNALIAAMLDHSHALILNPDEWLTVAAHDEGDRQIGGGDPYDTVTMVIRIKGTDLLALRGGRIARAEALQRVLVKEY